ncbi:hypothetical protein Z969_10140 [Clostridium novyi A str. 4570]|uniref:Uncharacterized protein n=1 Tax=Clostridium novyi A str. 4570 TaxID=1444290 RepID=A0AA89CL98_CLONO|nr:hypothetical protein [Clostridium novyi]KGN00088.1 hypothetical protein Z969_10140 [Clostridium novyi A str. 4570]
MKVEELINILCKTEKIMKLYKKSTVNEMLDDIYEKVSVRNTKDKIHKKPTENIDKQYYEKIINRIKGKRKDEIVKSLQRLRKKDILTIANLIDLKVDSSSTKKSLSEVIASHFIFINRVNSKDKDSVSELTELLKLK